MVTELVNEGANDLVYSSIGYTLGANLERVYLTGAGVVNATGNELNNALLGHANTAANVLTGGLGDDSYYVGAGDTAVEAASAGTDTVYAYADYTLGANLENLTGSAVTALRLSGNELGNTITGNAGGDTIDGGAGNDVLNGLAGVDTLSYASATAGVTVSLALATAQITGGAGTDTQSNFENLTGSAFGDSLTGNAAANVMDGGAGIDTLVGGAGDDTYHVDNAADVVTEAASEGIDTVIASVTRILGANQEKLTLTGTAAINATGNELNNVLTGNAGNNTVIGGAGADIMMGGAGNDSYEVMQLGDQVVENAGEGTDTIWTSINFSLADSPEVENLFKGGVSDFTGSGNALNNLIAGNAGNDVLDGGAGVDTVSYASAGAGVTVNLANTGLQATGGAGSDIVLNFENLTGSGFDDILSGNAENNVLNAGAGSDTVSYAGAVSGVSVNLALATAQITGGAGSDTVLNFENITGSAYNDTLTGTAGANKLDGGAGIDTLAGGAGDDTYVVDNAGDLVTEALNEGIDTVISAATRILGVNQENLILSGSAIINATGNELNNVLTGNAANNTLQGELGADTMSGGAGNDTYFVDDIGDVVVESAAEGTDTIHSTLSYILGANQEVVVLSTAAAVNATGNELNNSLYAGAGNNVIDGGLGIDTVSYNYAATGVTVSLAVSTAQATGGSGSDTLLNIENLEGSNYNDVLTGTSGNNIINGAVGADSMTGGAGDDTYYVDNIGDVVTELVNEGANDLVYSSIGYTLGANQEHLIASVATALRLSGNELNNNITGNAGGDTIDGGAGNDVLNGLAGVDTLSYALATAGVTVSLALATAQVTGGAGTDTVSNFENLTGSAFGDSLTGNAAANVMDGGAGADTLFGGAGDDLYLIDDLGDVVTEYLAAGTDLVQSSITYALSANVDNLTLTGSADINGTGNELANLLAGNSANNLLTGGAGDDTMLGGLGNDMYVVDVLTDIVIENVSEGTDTVQSVVTWALGTNFENLTLIGAASINGVGNALNNVIMGNTADNSLEGLDGNDTLNGGAGNDVLIGGAGNDSLLGGAGVDAMSGGLGNDSYEVLQVGDTVIEAAGGGIDIVWTAISYSLGAEVENLSNGSVNAFTGTGNDLDNRIAGNVGNDTLVGNLGNDVLIGGAGNDTINGGAGFDTAVFSGLKAGYTVTRGANGVTVSGADGVDLLTGIEKISFSDAITVLKPVSDFDGDGKSDILWRNTATGTNMIWKSGNSATGQAISGLTDQNWKLAGTGDFNGDGVSDILWRNTALGTNAIWKSGNAGTLQAATTIADQNWKIMGTGDFDGDGISDILWRNTAAGTNAIWKSGNSATLQAISAVTDQNWKIVGTGDFDGDGMSDILWRNTASGSITIWKSGNSVTVQNLATVADQNWKIMGSGDFNGDGNADILWRNIATGTNTIWQSGNSATPQAVTSVTDQNWKIAGTGDFDGDGKADILWRHSTTGAGTIWRSGDSATQQTVATEASQDWAIVDGLETGDLLTGGAGANTLEGTVSDDTVRGGGGNDTMSGGLGNDTYEVGETGDLIVENAGEGSDTVLTSVTYTLSANVETVILNAAGAINGTGNELANILHAGAGDNIIDGGTGIDTVVYDRSSAGVTVSLAMTGAQATGGSGSDSLLNIENLTGGNFNDILTGNAGANVLFGGVGNDFLLGGLGNDTYRFGRGYGVDTLVEDDATAGNTDVLRIDADIAHDQLWFAQSGNNLEITILGSASLVVVKDWYLGSAHRIERIESGNGKVLLESQVQNLVTAMSSFAPPVAGQLTLPSAYQTSLSPVLTTNWQ